MKLVACLGLVCLTIPAMAEVKVRDYSPTAAVPPTAVQSALAPYQGPQLRSSKPYTPAGGGCGALTVTQSVDPSTVEANNGVACAAGGITTPNSWGRMFDLSTGATAGAAVTVKCFDYGVESQGDSADMPLTIDLYTADNIDPGMATLTLLDSRVSIVPTGTALQVLTENYGAGVAVPADSLLFVSITSPQLVDGGFWAGGNSAGQTAPSYIMSADCGLPWTDIAAIGFPTNLVFRLDVDVAGGTVCGDGVCEGAEDCVSCAADCGACVCGDGACDSPVEDCASCTTDCGPCAPANDDCVNAEGIAIGGMASGSTIGAAVDAAPNCGTSVSAPGVWYSVVGDGSTMTASTCNTADYDTKITVVCGDCTDMFCAAGNDDGTGCADFTSEASWCSEAGVTYLILVHGFSSATGNFDLTVTSDGAACGSPPICVPGSCVNCTDSEGEPNGGCADGYADVYNAGCNSDPPTYNSPIACGDTVCGGSGTMDVDGTRDTDWWDITTAVGYEFTWEVTGDFPVLIFLLDVNAGCGGLVIVESATADPCMPAVVTGGGACFPPGSYNFWVGPSVFSGVGCGKSYEGTLTCVACDAPMPPANDNCADATAVAVPSDTAGDNTLATADGMDCNDGGVFDSSVWYTVVGTGNMMSATTCDIEGSNDDTAISVFCGDCDTPECVAAGEDTCGSGNGWRADATWCSRAGTTYYIAVGANFGTVGAFTLSVSDGGACSATTCVPPIPTGACCGCPDETCSVQTQADCDAAGGLYQGDDVACPAPGGDNAYAGGTFDIPDSDPVGASDTITVADAFTVLDVTVDVDISHTWIGDLCVSLTNGANTVLLQQRIDDATGLICDAAGCCGCSEDNEALTYGDSGTDGNINDQCGAGLSGFFVPEESLSLLVGGGSAGDWTLSVNDNAAGDTGTVNSWTLHLFQAAGADPLCGGQCTVICCMADGSCTDNAPASACDGTVITDGSVCENDADGDGTDGICGDNCPDDPNKLEPGTCGCGDQDTDGDGTCDSADNCPNDPNKTEPGICGCGTSDVDTDGDGVSDCNDQCPLDPNKVQPGQCGCGNPETADTDGDGTLDCVDGCIDDPLKTDPGMCGCGLVDPTADMNGDGNIDIDDCPEPVPTVSAWGLVILAMLLAVAGKVYFGRRRQIA